MTVFFAILRVILKDKCRSSETRCFLCLKMWSKDLSVGKRKIPKRPTKCEKNVYFE